MVLFVRGASGTSFQGAGSSRAPPAARRRVTRFEKGSNVRYGYSYDNIQLLHKENLSTEIFFCLFSLRNMFTIILRSLAKRSPTETWTLVFVTSMCR